MKSRINLVLAFACISLIASATFLIQQYTYLNKQLINNKLSCDNRIGNLRSKFDNVRNNLELEYKHSLSEQGSIISLPDSYNSANQGELLEKPITKPILDNFEESLEQIVARKYRFLLAGLNYTPEALQALNLLLLEREDIALMLNDAKNYPNESAISKDEMWDLDQILSDIDNRIAQLLDSDNNNRYTLLKDSDEEQKQFNQYALGINGLFPLDNKQQQAVLLTRLKHKKAFEDTIKTLNLDHDYPLTKQQSDELKHELEMAAMRYKHGYLMEIRDELDHDNYPFDQYTMLENYINTEFQKLLDSLNKKLAKRGVIN